MVIFNYNVRRRRGVAEANTAIDYRTDPFGFGTRSAVPLRLLRIVHSLAFVSLFSLLLLRCRTSEIIDT
jgi:hypothetical protein